MSIDYIRMRLKPHIPRTHLINLVEAQAAAFHALGYSGILWLDDYDPPLLSHDDPMWRQYREASDTLWSCLDVDEWRDGMDFYVSSRVSPITNSDVFPVEWEQAAYRTYLPDQLPAQLAAWRQYLTAVRH